MIQQIRLDQAQPGMILGESILDSGGQVLIGAGEALTDRLIRRLAVRGTREIGVQVEELAAAPDDPETAGSPETTRVKKAETEEEIRELLDRRFQHFENHEIMQTIRTLAEKHLIQNLGSSEIADTASGADNSS